jgi:hypothetical protein
VLEDVDDFAAATCNHLVKRLRDGDRRGWLEDWGR